jgi:hypothetical protein
MLLHLAEILSATNQDRGSADAGDGDSAAQMETTVACCQLKLGAKLIGFTDRGCSRSTR